MEKKLTLSFVVGEAIGDESKHRLSCEVNVVYLAVGTAAVLVIATVLWFALATSLGNAAVLMHNVTPESDQNLQTLTTETPETNAIANAEINYRLDIIRNITLAEWNAQLGYYATKNLNRTWHNNSDPYLDSYGFKLMVSMSTLWVANLKKEFAHAKTWIKPLKKFSTQTLVSVAVTQYVGSMESCYALTDDVDFLDLAQEATNVLKKAHQENGLPWYWAFSDDDDADSDNHQLDQLSPYLEYRYMAGLTQDSQLNTTLSKYRGILKNWPKTKNGLHTSERKNGIAVDNLLTFLSLSQFYSYLIKSYIQSNYTDHELNTMFNQAIEALDAAGEIDMSNGQIEELYPAGYCNLGAMFGLSAWAKNKSRDHDDDDAVLMKKHWNWAVQFTDKCHYVFLNETELASTDLEELLWIINRDRYLSSHRAECYFVLYCLTGDPKYREYAWELVQNINTFLNEVDVYVSSQNKIRFRPHNFMDSTLKYLYLTFAQKSLLSLDEWVFNLDGQPLPICGRNRMYPGEKCGRKHDIDQ